MDITMIQDFIKPELLVLIIVLNIIGTGLKKSKLNDKFIPLVLGSISIVLTSLWVFATSELNGGRDIVLAIFTAITQGILLAGTSVYANQLYKQLKK
jgi:hypothetical protein